MISYLVPQIANKPIPSRQKKKRKEPQHEKNQSTGSYEDILMQYTEEFDEKEKYKQLYLDLKSRQQSIITDDTDIINQLQQENMGKRTQQMELIIFINIGKVCNGRRRSYRSQLL